MMRTRQVAESSRGVLSDAAHVAQVGVGELEQALVVKKDDRLFGRVPLNASQASNNRDSLAKILYNQLFDWIRGRINGELSLESSGGGPRAPDASEARTVGLLDIFGFESFTVFDSRAKAWRTANRCVDAITCPLKTCTPPPMIASTLERFWLNSS